MFRSKLRDVKRAKKKSLYLEEISSLLLALSQDEPSIRNAYITRVDLSADNGVCYVFFNVYPDLKGESTEESCKKKFKEILSILKLYKPSLRKAFASKIKMRYVPDFRFLYDEKKEKERKITKLLDKVHEELCQEEKK